MTRARRAARARRLGVPLRPARFSHIVLRTERFKPMARGYKTVLHAEPLFEIPRGAFPTFDDELHRVLVLADPAVTDRPPTAEGVAHFASLFDSLGDLMTTYARLRDEEGITPTDCVNHGFALSLCDHAPYRNEVALGCDNFATREEMNAWFRNGDFAKNFFGDDFDPSLLHPSDTDDGRPSVVGGASLFSRGPESPARLSRRRTRLCVPATLLCGREPEVREMLALPEPWATHAMGPIGWPTGTGQGPLRRRPVADAVMGDRFGEPFVD